MQKYAKMLETSREIYEFFNLGKKIKDGATVRQTKE